MRTSRINIGTKVFNKKNQEGTITKVITKSTGYVEVTYINGLIKKEMAFNLTDENGESLKATPKAKKQTMTIADKIESTKQGLLDANTRYNQSLLDAYMSVLNKVNTDNQFINSLIDTFAKASVGTGRISEKQAYYLAKFMVENNI
jgi:hypothetical protein|nr:MAG TPA: hypothetical protein [Caudoviricetes sp.]